MLRQLHPLWPFLRRYRKSYLLGSLCIVASIGVKLQIPRFFWGALERLRELEEAHAIDVESASRTILVAAGWILAAALLIAPIRTASRLLILGNSRKVAHDVLRAVYARMLRLAPSFYLRNPIGQVMSRCVNDRASVQSLGGPVVMYISEVTTLYALSVPLMLSIDAPLAVLALLPYPVFLVLARRMAVRIQQSGQAAQQALGEISEKADESLSGQLVIKTLTLESFDLERFRERCAEYRRLNLRVTRLRALLIASMMGLAALSSLVVLGIGGPAVLRGEMAFDDLGVMLTYVAWLATPTRTLGFVISSMRRGAAALGRIRELLEAEVTLDDPVLPPGEAAPTIREGAISLRGLTVVYPPPSRQQHLLGGDGETRGEGHRDVGRVVLDSVSLEIPAGTTLGVVGHTGSGKTTLARVLARQLEVDRGQVFVDGHDLLDLPLAEVRRQTGYVPQDAFLFGRSLAENVALGRPQATLEEIEEAVLASRLEADLAQLPDGLDTLVGERGVTLSGGQRQRAALARVLLLSPRILILDDTLSAVDTHTADAILEHLRPFAAARTTVLVSHRLSTVNHADLIVVLENGRVVEQGTHRELLALGGRYAATWRHQERRERQATRASRLRRELEREARP